MNKIKQLWSNLRSSFWFTPTLIVALSIALAVALIETDSTESDQWLARWPRLFGSGAEGARGMLSTIAASIISVVGVTFSMTLVALSLFFGFILALGGVGVLIFFIHHIASSIQASSIIASVAQETISAIDRLFPEEPGHAPMEDEDQAIRLLAKRNWCAVPAKESGYIQSVDHHALLRLARHRKTIVRLVRGIGEFVVQNAVLASPAMDIRPDKEAIAATHAAYRISRHRTVEQDPAYGIRQLADVALKALSPGVTTPRPL